MWFYKKKLFCRNENARPWCPNDSFTDWQLVTMTRAALMIVSCGKYDRLDWQRSVWPEIWEKLPSFYETEKIQSELS